MKYDLIGPFPPPLGGISVFAYRFAKLLKMRGHEVEIVDFSKQKSVRKWVSFLRLIFNPQKQIYYLNGHEYLAMLGLVLRPYKGIYIFHDHSGRMIEAVKGLRRVVFQLFLNRVDECMLVGSHIYEHYRRQGYRLPSNTRIQNAFLPPPIEDEPAIWQSYDPTVLTFVNDHKPLIIANAFKITFYNDIDLYGLDLCVDLVAQLKNEHPNIGLLFALAEIGDFAYYEEINRRIDGLGVRDHFYFMTGQKELWPLFRKADLMIRPTYVDGYGVSIAEAHWLGCPTIASDVCDRAEGTILFRNRDVLDLVGKIRKALHEISS